MKNLNLNALGVKEMNTEEIKLTNGGFIFITAAVAIAIGGAFVTGVGIGVALYLGTNEP